MRFATKSPTDPLATVKVFTFCVKPASLARSITNAVSLTLLSLHERLICVCVAAPAASAEGAVGAAGPTDSVAVCWALPYVAVIVTEPAVSALAERLKPSGKVRDKAAKPAKAAKSAKAVGKGA